MNRRLILNKLQYLIIKHDRMLDLVAELLCSCRQRELPLDPATMDLLATLHHRRNRLTYLFEQARVGAAVEQLSKLFGQIDFAPMNDEAQRLISKLEEVYN
jgi:hypothetical protein